MELPTTRLFHLHYNVPNVPRAEHALADFGIPLQQRFGRIGGKPIALDPDESEPDGFRLRLQTRQRGYANLTLAPGRELRFDHLGLCSGDFEAIVDRAEERNWSVRNAEGHRRPFVMTPWGFRVELHRDGSAVESSLGDWDEAHLSNVVLRVENPTEVRDELSAVFGDVPGLDVRAAEDAVDRAFVPQFRLDGDASRGRTFEATALDDG